MDITKLTIGRPVRIKTEDDIYDSYISAITLKDENFVYFKSGSIRVALLDKLKKSSGGSGNKLDKTGGVILGNLDVIGSLTKNRQEIVTHNTDKSIISGGTFNRGSWNEPNEGALTQIIDNSGSQHSVIVGKGKDGNRHYGIDLLDSYDNPQMKLYAGDNYLLLAPDGLIHNGKNITNQLSNLDYYTYGININSSNVNLLKTLLYTITFNITETVTLENGLTLPIYTRGMLITGGSGDAALIAMDYSCNLYLSYRNNGVWSPKRTL